MARSATLPALSSDSGLAHYFSEIRKFPMLEPQQEFMLAKAWKEHEDRDSAHQMVTSHLRLVAKIAMGYRGYGLPISEVISEGNVGLATYAMWWIKAAIQEYILRSWSLVKMGTTANQKKLFFNLRKAKGKISALEEGDMRPDQVALIAKRLGVTHPTALKNIARLKREGLATSRPYRGVFLTDSGRELADRVRARHRLIVELMLAVGVPREAAEADAEGMEHHASEATLKAFSKFLGRKG